MLFLTTPVSMHRKKKNPQQQDFCTHPRWSKGGINFDLAYKPKVNRLKLVSNQIENNQV